MNKSAGFFAVFLTATLMLANPVTAQMPEGGHEHGGETMHENKGGMMKHMGMHGMMMKSAMPQSMATTPDGSIVVLAGNKLLKYDQDLNLVKEQTIQTDFSGMQNMMQQMKEQCPMCRQMMSE